MTMLKQIEDIRKDKSILWRYGKSKKTAIQEIIDALDGLIKGRAFLPDGFEISDVVGLPLWFSTPRGKIGLSYRQIYSYVVRFAKTGRHLKRPYMLNDDQEDI